MKNVDRQRQTDYLLLHHIVGKYLEKCLNDSSVAPRYLELETIKDIVTPFHEIKPLIQRVEWLREEHVDDLLHFLAASHMSVEELKWAIDMFAVQKQEVINRIEARAYANE